ncbi:Gelsolin, cytoplasmic [Eumeta japonica]|uniref:Gelsolin, cytoplasmic n=1 Tax=Eumeta variegata TaxID=151549 RepID=A0A4C1ZP89_EUMVA|nr:Gelsolin, cytoplasmic [Eumeta japonica]
MNGGVTHFHYVTISINSHHTQAVIKSNETCSFSVQESDEKEQEAAREFLGMVVPDEREVVAVEQGGEPDEFWDALGGNVDEKEDNSGWRNAVNRRVNADTTLTAVTVKLTGAVILENMANAYTQEGSTANDLSDDSVYILDTGEEIYFWRGKNVPERVKAAKYTIIETYLEKDGLDRSVDSAVVVTVKQGKEPKVFQKLFPSWDSDMWEQSSYIRYLCHGHLDNWAALVILGTQVCIRIHQHRPPHIPQSFPKFSNDSKTPADNRTPAELLRA